MNTTGALPGVDGGMSEEGADGGMPEEDDMGLVTIIGAEASNANVVYPNLKAANVSEHALYNNLFAYTVLVLDPKHIYLLSLQFKTQQASYLRSIRFMGQALHPISLGMSEM